jgi:hypothetical protein
LDLERARFLSALLQTLGSGASALWNGLGKRTIEHWAGLRRPVTHATEVIHLQDRRAADSAVLLKRLTRSAE